MPRNRANIDHIAVAPSGIWVIDAKAHQGRVNVVTPVFGRDRLTVAGRDKSGLTVGLAKQVAAVEGVANDVAEHVPIQGALCFIDADLPMLRTLSFGGFPILDCRGLTKRINARGPVSPDILRVVAAHLAERLQPA